LEINSGGYNVAHKVEEILSRKPPTSTVQSRIDMRTLASLYLFWTKQGEMIRSLSELVRVSLEVFSDFLISSEKAEEVKGQEEAIDILRRAGLGTKYLETKNKSILIRELQKHHLNVEGFDPSYLHKKSKKHSKAAVDNPSFQEAVRRMENADLEEQPDIKERVKSMLERDEELNELGTIPDRKEDV